MIRTCIPGTTHLTRLRTMHRRRGCLCTASGLLMRSTRVPCTLKCGKSAPGIAQNAAWRLSLCRSEEHTSELQSQFHLVCRLLLEKKKKNNFQDILHENKITEMKLLDI